MSGESVTFEVAYINLRVDGMSRHSNVDGSGVSRSINGACTCIRAWHHKTLENRVVGVWIKEARLSPWPDGELGTLIMGQEANIYLPPDAFEHAWETALAPTNKQLNLRVPVVSDGEPHQDHAIVGYSLDELEPPKPVQKAERLDFSKVIFTAFQILLVLYACYAVAKYLKGV